MSPAIPLPQLLLIVVGGVAGVVALSALVGWSREALIADEDSVRAAWAGAGEDGVAEEIVAMEISTDRRGALLELADGKLGLVTVLGDKGVVGRLHEGELRRLRVEGGRLELRFVDLGRAPVRLLLQEPSAWAARLVRAGVAPA